MILGSGSANLANGIRYWQDRMPDRIWFFDGYDEPLAHRLFAGSDLFFMPSRFEPCGLAQMQAMAYGSIPVVTKVGGLADTVIDADRDRDNGTGFVSESVDDASILDALHRAHRATRVEQRRDAIVTRGMTLIGHGTCPLRSISISTTTWQAAKRLLYGWATFWPLERKTMPLSEIV